MPTDKQKKARNKWDAENMALIACKARKSEAEQFKEYAAARNTTVNALLLGFVRRCLNEQGSIDVSQDDVPSPAAPDPAPSDPVPEPMPRTATVKPIPIHPKPSGSGETLDEVLARKRADRTTQQEAEAFEQRQRNPRPKPEDGMED